MSAFETAKLLLAEKRYFDGVQSINAAVEGWEAEFVAAHPDIGFKKMDVLRIPAEWIEKCLPLLSPDQQKELSAMFALRAQLLAGLGAQKRAVVDVDSAMKLQPGDESLEAVKKAVFSIGQEEEANQAPKTSVTIITGFLGAGKTTLLNHILQENHGKKIAVIENEFGEVGIDDALLNTKSAVTEENVIEMNNGCICCTVRGDLIAGLKKLHRQTSGKGKPLDGIIIETTGLADPAPVAQTFFADEFVQANMQLDGILTVVDAKHCLEHLREEKPDGIVNEAVEQVAFADRILLNKTDLVSSEYLDEVQSEIRCINATAQMKRTTNAEVDMDFVLGIRAFSLDKVLETVNEGFLEDEEQHGHGGGHGHGEGHGGGSGHGDGHDCGEDNCDGHGDGHGHGGGHAQGHVSGHGHGHDADAGKKKHQHDYRVTSVGLERDAEVSMEKLNTFLSWLRQEKGPDLFRSKGVLAVNGLKEKFVFHAVHMQFGASPQEPWKEGEKRRCKMVFIGKNMNRAELNEKFDECLVR